METQKKSLGTIRSQTDQIQEGQEQRFNQQQAWVGQFNNGDASPNVQNVDNWMCGSGVVTITDFRNGQNGQTIHLLGNANTTIQHGTKIMTNTGANKTLASNKVYKFTRFNNVWYEAE